MEGSPSRRHGGGDFDWDAMRQVSQLEQENSKLKMLLQEANREVTSLRGLAHRDQGGPNLSATDILAGEVKGNRVQELSKQNRNLNLALEREKNNVKKLEAELRAAQRAANSGMSALNNPEADPNSVAAIAREMVEEAAAAAHAAETRADDYKEKYEQACSKLDRETLKNSQHKAEVEKLRRVLAKECGLGEGEPLQRILEEAADWRGRAQQITLLKDKVKDLKAKLAAGGGGGGGGGGGVPSSAGGSPKPSIQGSPTHSDSGSVFSKHETKVRKNLERLELERRQNSTSVEAEVTAAREELAAVQKRLNGAVARRNVVESECRDLKDKVQMLLEKTDNDDKLIDALKTELRKSSMRKPTGAAPGAGAPRASANAAVTAAETAALEERVREKEAQVQRQEKIILALQSQVQAATTSGVPKEAVRVLEVEKDKLEELVQLFRSRLDIEEKKNGGTVAQLQAERIKVVELQRQLESAGAGGSGARPRSATTEKVTKLEGELLRVSAECHRLQTVGDANRKKYEEELGLYKTMLQTIRKHHAPPLPRAPDHDPASIFGDG